MPSTPHVESYFEASDTVRDIVIGMSDGLTVPFALAAGVVAAPGFIRAAEVFDGGCRHEGERGGGPA